MSTTSEPRSAAAVNQAIRALWVAGTLAPTDREAYQRLLAEWARAKERELLLGEVVEAA